VSVLRSEAADDIVTPLKRLDFSDTANSALRERLAEGPLITLQNPTTGQWDVFACLDGGYTDRKDAERSLDYWWDLIDAPLADKP
jgi:hypothetical protein